METVLKIKNMNVWYQDTQILSNISMEVKAGEFLGIIGPNGGGKSTLLKAILGLVPYDSGEVKVFEETIGKTNKKIGYVPQFSLVDRKFPISVFEVTLQGRMKSGTAPFFKYSKEDKEVALSQLEKVNLIDYKDRQISELSGGEFQKLLIARALAVGPSLLLLDEPTASVDAKAREQIYTLLEKLNEKMTIIMATHDLLAISSTVKSLGCLNNQLVYHGEPKLSPEMVKNLYGCPIDLIAHGVPHRVFGEHRGNEK